MKKGLVAMSGQGSDGDWERRRGAVDAARHSIEMEGGQVSGAARADQDRYVDGEVSAEDLVVLVKERMYAEGRPPACCR